MRTIQTNFILIILLFFGLNAKGQDAQHEKISHTGIFLQATATKQVFSSQFFGSSFKPGIAAGIQQHFDLDTRLQLRVGGAISFYSIDEKDYSPLFPSDFDTITGMADIRKSYIQNQVKIIQLNFPVSFRYKLTGDARHFYVSGGLEGRIVVSDSFKSRFQESGLGYLEFNNEPFFSSRNPVIATLMELGYEFPYNSNKLNISLIGKYVLSSQFKGQGSAFNNIIQGKALDIGLGIGLIL